VLACRSFCSDNEKPKGDATTAAIVDIPTSNEPPSQEAGVVVKLPVAPVKKGNSRSSKRLKKAAVASSSLDAHRPVVSTDDVSTAPCDFFVYCLNFPAHVFLLTDFDEEVRLFGH
jgi:hypothetical protein